VRYLWITKNFPPSMGGVQQYTSHYVQNFTKGSCVVLTRNQGNEREVFHVDELLVQQWQKVYRLSAFPAELDLIALLRHPVRLVIFCWMVVSIVRKEKIERVIFAHPSFLYYCAAVILKLLPFFNLPVIGIFHGEDIPAIKMKSNGLFLWLINRLDVCICNSKFTHDRLQRFLGRSIPELIAYPGVEMKFFTQLDKIQCKRQFNIEGRSVLYTVGRLDERKGHDLVIKALPEIRKQIPDVIYLIGGKGPYLSRLQELVSQLELNDVVIFCGFIADDDICAFHRCGDVFVMPNRILADGDTEGFGIVFLEAAAAGNPVIGGRAGGALDAVIDGETGFLVDPTREEEFIDKAVVLLKDNALANKLGNAGQKRALEKFCWPVLAPQLEHYLEQVKG